MQKSNINFNHRRRPLNTGTGHATGKWDKDIGFYTGVVGYEIIIGDWIGTDQKRKRTKILDKLKMHLGRYIYDVLTERNGGFGKKL